MKHSARFVVATIALLLAPLANAQTNSQPLPGILTAPAAPMPATPPPVASISTGNAEPRFKEALELVKQNQLPEAETALQELARDFPLLSGPQTELGLLYIRTKRVQPAIQAFQRAIQANPQNAVAYNGLGMMMRESRDYVRAEQAYLRAVALNPSYAAANLNLGILYDAYLNRPHNALSYYKRYVQLGGQEDLRVLVWIAQIEKLPPPPVKPATATTPTQVPAAASGKRL